jgi:iron complex transport system substrate-binding protein
VSIRLALAAVLLALSAVAGRAEPVTITDAAGRSVTVSDTSRIVAIGGAVTEILYALGVGDRIAAVDTTSVYPAAAAAKPQVGYMRALSAEGVLSLGPTVVIAIEGSGPAETIEVLERASVPFVLVPDAKDPAGIADKIRFVAKIVGAEAKGEEVASAVAADLAALGPMRDTIGAHRKAVFILGMAGGSAMVGGSGTAADAIFALAGVDNALPGIAGYKPASDEAALAADPDAVVVMSERGHDLTADKIFSLPAFKGSPAAADRRLVSLPGSYFLVFGPRTAQAAHDLAAAIYPEKHLPALPARPWAAGPVAPAD